MWHALKGRGVLSDLPLTPATPFQGVPRRSKMPPLHCPICQREFRPEDSTAMPFCSQRCRLLDLGRWLDERYGLPVEREETEGQPPRTDEEEY